MARLLVADDNEMNRDMLSRRLRREGFEVEVAVNGRDALERLTHSSFDLALLDIMMPEVSGLEALAEMRKTRTLAELPIIMVTAKTQSEDIIEALRLGANDYITKPIDLPVLLARVRTHLELKRLSELKDEFIRIASHDIKNPLTEILGTAGLLEKLAPPGTPMPERLYGLVVNLKRSASRIRGIVEDFLDFQALQAGAHRIARETVDLNDLAREAVECQGGYAASKGSTVALEVDPEVPGVVGDRPRLAQALQNLLDNAIKYSPRGSTVRVVTRRADSGARLEVVDQGPGVPEADHDRIFQRFGRSGAVPTGGERSTGLGLSIARQLVEAHGGTMGVRNNPDTGSTFWFELPANIATPLPYQ